MKCPRAPRAKHLSSQSASVNAVLLARKAACLPGKRVLRQAANSPFLHRASQMPRMLVRNAQDPDKRGCRNAAFWQQNFCLFRTFAQFRRVKFHR